MNIICKKFCFNFQSLKFSSIEPWLSINSKWASRFSIELEIDSKFSEFFLRQCSQCCWHFHYGTMKQLKLRKRKMTNILEFEKWNCDKDKTAKQFNFKFQSNSVILGNFSFAHSTHRLQFDNWSYSVVHWSFSMIMIEIRGENRLWMKIFYLKFPCLCQLLVVFWHDFPFMTL